MFKSRRRRTPRSPQRRNQRWGGRRVLRVECLEDRALLTTVPTLDVELQSDTAATDDSATVEAWVGEAVIDEGLSDFCTVEMSGDSVSGEPTVDGNQVLAESTDDGGVYGPQEWIAPSGDADGDPLSPLADPDPTAEEEGWDYSEEEGWDDPWIDYFDAVRDEGDIWYFEGKVDFHHPTVLKVYFGGHLDGESAEVDEYGVFTFTAKLEIDYETVVSAQARGKFDGDPVESNTEEVVI